jgi:DNA polymerase-3 subunit epsilon
MRILFVDTETTGLPKNRNSNALETSDNWPDIVSVSWAVYDNGVRKFIKYALIKPGDWVIPEDSTKIHGITMDYAIEHGESLYEVLHELREDLVLCDSVVAHNLEFDKNVLFHAYKWRLNMNPWPFWPKDEICTMIHSESEVKIPSKYPKPGRLYKPPTLKELYKATFDRDPEGGLHNSQRDVEVLCEIYWKRWSDSATL